MTIHTCCKFPRYNVGVSRLFSILSHTRRSASTTAPPQREFLKDKLKKVWNGPTFKYWFIGGTVFVSWMSYYGLKSYQKTRVNIEILPPLPSHVTVKRSRDIEKLLEKYEAEHSFFGGEKVRKLMVLGASGSGKTLLIHDFAKHLIEKQQGFKYSLPKSQILVFLQADTEQSFILSLKAFAAKFKIKPSELNDAVGESFSKASYTDQCDALLSCIQSSIKKHPDWIIVLDNVQVTTPQSVVDIVNRWFISQDTEEWSRGSVFVVHEGLQKLFDIKDEHQYVNCGLNQEDAYRFLQEFVNFGRGVPISESFRYLLDKLFSNPLAILCAAMLLKDRLSQKEAISIDKVIKDLCTEIDSNLENVAKDNQHISEFISSKSGSKLVTIETLVAMAINNVFSKDRYLWHGFDMLSTIKPGTSVPQCLLVRHLRNPSFKLPPLVPSGISNAEFFNKQKSDLAAVQSKVDEFEPKGKAWSNKNLSEYVRKVEEFFATGFNMVKDIYNLIYGILPELPEKGDGLDMFRNCELLQRGVVEPGDTKAVSMHPIVYNAARQYFLSASIPNIENEHLLQNEYIHDNQSWYKRLSNFSEQTCLHALRTSHGHQQNEETKEQSPLPFLERYNRGINVSSVFKFEPFVDKKDEFWILKDVEKFHYLQSHVAEVCKSICDDIGVIKGDVSGRSTKHVLLTHLEYVLNNHPLELIGRSAQVESLQTVATCYSTLYNDLTRSKSIIEDVLKLQKSTNAHPLEISKTLTKLASVHQSSEELSEAKDLLEEAAEFHEADRRKSGEYKESLEFGKLLGQLGVVYGALQMKREAKETIERSLMLKQVKPPDLSDEPLSKQYGAGFSTSLTDLGHAYVSLGMPLYGKKILDLALAAQKNLLGDNHPEVVRTLTILAVAHLMQGHNEESKKLRFEAGKIQAAINALPSY